MANQKLNKNDNMVENKSQIVQKTKHAKLGYVQVYTGTGKGKTTAALGLGLRAIGKGFKVYMIQFMKGNIEYGEITAVRQLKGFIIEQFGRPDFVDRKNPKQIDIDFAKKALNRAREVLKKREYQIIILDEINVAIDWNLLDVNDVLELIKTKPKGIELILTGRYAHPKILELADLVTDMREVKHPFQHGVLARDGIEH